MSVNDYSTTPASNTAISGIDIGEGCAPAGINNAIRQMMADIRALSDSLSIGTQVQGYDATLAALAGLSVSADKIIYATGTDAFEVSELTTIGRNFLASTTKEAARSQIGVNGAGTLNFETTPTDTDESVPTSKAIRDYITANVPGINQDWVNRTSQRQSGTSYQNTSGKMIKVHVVMADGALFQVSDDNANWLTVGRADTDQDLGVMLGGVEVNNLKYYRVIGGIRTDITPTWVEYR